jgi:ubiquinone/menaquinone biosynthesis C-methylase UbiE
LDLSCGEGFLLNLIGQKNPQLTLHGVDISSPTIEKAKQNYPSINFSQSEAKTLPFEEDYFDIIICAMSLHHYEEVLLVLTEVVRTLKHGGTAYFMDIFPKNSISQRIYNLLGCYEPYHFEKFYTTDEFVGLVEQQRLQSNQIYRLGYLPRLSIIKVTKN